MIIDREGQVFDRPDCDGEVADYKVEYLKNEKYCCFVKGEVHP